MKVYTYTESKYYNKCSECGFHHNHNRVRKCAYYDEPKVILETESNCFPIWCPLRDVK